MPLCSRVRTRVRDQGACRLADLRRYVTLAFLSHCELNTDAEILCVQRDPTRARVVRRTQPGPSTTNARVCRRSRRQRMQLAGDFARENESANWRSTGPAEPNGSQVNRQAFAGALAHRLFSDSSDQCCSLAVL